MTDGGAVDRRTTLVVGLVSGSHFVAHAYLTVLPPVLPTLAAEFDVGLGALGLAIAALWTTNTVFQLPFGWLSDTYSRTGTLAVSLGVATVGIGLTAVAGSYLALVAAQAVVGLGIAANHPAHYPLLSAATPEDRLGRAYSAHAFGGALGFAAGPAVVTGVLALGGTWRTALLAVAVGGGVYAALAVAVLATRVDRAVRRPPERESVPGLRARLRGATADVAAAATAPGLMTLVALAFVTAVAAWGVRTYVPVLLVDGYGLSRSGANLVLTAMLVVGAGFILVGGDLSDRRTALGVVLAGYLLLTGLAGLAASALVPTAAVVACVLLLDGALNLGRPARSKLADDLSARADLGKSFALVTVGITAGGAVAPPLFGALIERAGVTPAFGLVAALGLVGVGLTRMLRSHASARSPAATAEG